jgi:hypothetical protein
MAIVNAYAEAAVDAIVGTVAKVNFYTDAYAALLGTTTIAFGSAAVSAGNAVATIGSTPITGESWDATGTVGSVRMLTSGDVVVLERDDANAVGVTGSGAFIELSTLSATSGGSYELTSGTISLPVAMNGES